MRGGERMSLTTRRVPGQSDMAASRPIRFACVTMMTLQPDDDDIITLDVGGT